MVPCNEIVSGGPPKDGIPALTDPEKLTVSENNWVDDEDIVIGVIRNGEACAYPLSIFFWHEIVNDDLGGERSIITYCPLTGTGIHFDGSFSGGKTDFGVSGSLWNNNLILYNRSGEESWWSQIWGQAIIGPAMGEKLTVLPAVETTWGTWKELRPDTKVLSRRTGFSRDYTVYPYGDYEELGRPPLFPMDEYLDFRQPPKMRVLGVHGLNTARAYSFALMETQELLVVNDQLEGELILVVHHPESRMALAFNRTLENGRTLRFSLAEPESGDPHPFAMIDEQTGSRWSVLGEAVSGELEGEQLDQRPDGLVAFWFAWAAFHQGTELFDPRTHLQQSRAEGWEALHSTNENGCVEEASSP